MLDNTDGQPTKNINKSDDDARHRFSADKPTGPIHAGEKVGLSLEIESQEARLIAADCPCLHI